MFTSNGGFSSYVATPFQPDIIEKEEDDRTAEEAAQQRQAAAAVREDDDNALGWYFVQLAPWATGPSDGPIAPIRQAQLSALSLPHTAYATAADLGDPFSPLFGGNIHPRGKMHIAQRLVRALIALEYGRRGGRSRGGVKGGGGREASWRGPMVKRVVPASAVTGLALAGAATSTGGSSNALSAASPADLLVEFHSSTCGGGALQLIDPGGCPIAAVQQRAEKGTKQRQLDAASRLAHIRCAGFELLLADGSVLAAAAVPAAIVPAAAGIEIALPPPSIQLEAEAGGVSARRRLADGNKERTGQQCLLLVRPHASAVANASSSTTSSPPPSPPIRLRYGQANWPLLSVYDGDGLPALPFDVAVG